MTAVLCAVCEGAGRVVEDGEPMKCTNAACWSGYVNDLACKRCTGIGCVHCGDTGEESVRRELQDCGEHPAVKL